MDVTSLDRLRSYLRQLPPSVLKVLIRRFETNIARGDDVAVANFILKELRHLVFASSDEEPPSFSGDSMEPVFRPLGPFLVDAENIRLGQIRRASLRAVWDWLRSEGCPEAVQDFEKVLSNRQARALDIEIAARILRLAAAKAIVGVASGGAGRFRGGGKVSEDILAIGTVLNALDELQQLGGRLPDQIGHFDETATNKALAALGAPTLHSEQVMPFAVSLVMSRLVSPWEIVRLGIRAAGTDKDYQVARTSYGLTILMAFQELTRIAAEMRDNVARGQYVKTCEYLTTLHDGIRGLRTDLDIGSESVWGRQLATLRADIAKSLVAAIDSIPGRVRRLLQPLPDRLTTPVIQLDQNEVSEAAAQIDFVKLCIMYANELAINEASWNAYLDLERYIERTTEALITRLRTSNPEIRAHRQAQLDAALRFCEIMFGSSYAALKRRVADLALADVIKAQANIRKTVKPPARKPAA